MKKNGQVAIIVLLVSALAMSLGLSTSKRTIVDTKIDTDNKDLQEAFNVADSGLNTYLGGSIGSDNIYYSGIGSSAKIEVSPLLPTDINGISSIKFANFVAWGNRAYFWLMDTLADGSLDVSKYYQGQIRVCVDSNFAGGILIEDFYKTAGGGISVVRSGYNILSSGLIAGFTDLDNTKLVSCGNGMNGFLLGVLPQSVLLTASPLSSQNPMLRGSSILLQATNGGVFPQQGVLLSAIGAAGSTQKVVRVEKRRTLPMDLAILLDGVVAAGKVDGN